MRRNEILHTRTRRFILLIEESVLRYQLGNSVIMITQLRHLLNSMALPSISLGVIPFSVSRQHIWTVETFTIFDDAMVNVELVSAQVNITAPSEVSLYVSAFRSLKELAVYGERAQALITDAISVLM
jgi:Domain of unknown function (DUF5753)